MAFIQPMRRGFKDVGGSSNTRIYSYAGPLDCSSVAASDWLGEGVGNSLSPYDRYRHLE